METIINKSDINKLQQLKNNPDTAPTIKLLFSVLEQALLDVVSENKEERLDAGNWLLKSKWVFKLFNVPDLGLDTWLKRLYTDTVFRRSESRKLKRYLNHLTQSREWNGNVCEVDFKNIK